jgi:hypothetical protein
LQRIGAHFNKEILMAKLATMLSAPALVLSFALAACSTYDPNYTASPPNPDPAPQSTLPPTGAAAAAVPAPISYRPGNGVVESVSIERSAPSAGAGGTVGNVGLYRMTVRMDDGSLQTIVQDNPNFRPGDRVQLTADGRVIRL